MSNCIGRTVYFAQPDGRLERLGQIYELNDLHLAIIDHGFIVCYYRRDQIIPIIEK